MDVSFDFSELTTIGVQVDENVARIELNRPHRRNALTDQLCDELSEVLRILTNSIEIRVLVVQGAGDTFSSGGDTKEVSGRRVGTLDQRRQVADRWQILFDRLLRLPQVTVAKVRGAAIGGGAMLALSCDLRVADTTAFVRIPELTLGRFLIASGCQRLVSELGVARARDLLLTGRTVNAEIAESWSIFHRVVAPNELDEHTADLARDLAAVNPIICGMTRRALQAAVPDSCNGVGLLDAYLALVEE